MVKRLFPVLLILISVHCSAQTAPKTLTIPSADGITITGDVYAVGEGLPWILLCHQAGWSRGEYQETGPWLNENGFNCLAIDQRSGGKVNGVVNETNAEAKKHKKGTEYADAEQDIVAAMEYLFGTYGQPVILVGSSYSSSLVLKVAAEHPDKVRAVAAFAPGEYFGDAFNIAESIEGMDIPAFFTGSREEMQEQVPAIARAAACTNKVLYTPDGAGHHGARALWTSKEGYRGYREAFLNWLQSL